MYLQHLACINLVMTLKFIIEYVSLISVLTLH